MTMGGGNVDGHRASRLQLCYRAESSMRITRLPHREMLAAMNEGW